MSGYDQFLIFLTVLILGFSGGGLYYANKVRRLDISIRRHEAMLAEQQAREAATLHPAE